MELVYWSVRSFMMIVSHYLKMNMNLLNEHYRVALRLKMYEHMHVLVSGYWIHGNAIIFSNAKILTKKIFS